MTDPDPSNNRKLIAWLLKKELITENNQPSLLGHSYISITLIMTVIISYIIMLIVASCWQKKWLNCPAETQVTQESLFGTSSEAENQHSVTQKCLFGTSSETENQIKKRLTDQINTINDLSVKHCRIMAFFYTQYYATLSIGATAGIISLVCTLLISKEGWKATNNAVINIWITSFFVTLFYLNIAQIFQQQENLKTSQQLYNSYVSLQNEFLSAIAIITDEQAPNQQTDQPSSNGQNSLPFKNYKELIVYTDSQLKELSFISLGFDPTPINNIVEQTRPGFNEGKADCKK